MLKMEFTLVDSFTGQPEAFCPLGRSDIRWVGTGWRATLLQTLEAKVVARLHKYNKHLAVWQARRLIQAWSKGSVDSGADASEMDFLGRDAAGLVLPRFT